MNFKENIRIAVFSIRTNLMRSLLTMLGIIIGVSSVIAIITVGNGGRDYIIGMIKDMGSSAITINVRPNEAEDSDYITDDDIAAIKALETVDYVSPMAMSMGSLSAGEEKGMGVLIGGNADLKYVLNGDCAYGRYFTESEVEQGKAVGVIDVQCAMQFFGRADVVGEYVNYKFRDTAVRIKVIGVTDMASSFGMDSNAMMENMEAMGDASMTGGMVMVPCTLTTQIMGTVSRYDTIYVMAKDESDLEDAGNAAMNRLRARHNNHDRDCYALTNMATYIDLLDTVINVFTIFIAAVSAISLVVGGIGVMNIMLVSITERTREIGIRKALGARTSTIMFQFLTESIILCLIGGIIGLLLGVAGAMIVSEIMNVPLSIKLSTILLALGFSTFIGVVFGVYPARRAAKMQPIEALRRD